MTQEGWTLILSRHGNRERQDRGQGIGFDKDLPLTDTGREEALIMGYNMRSVIDRIDAMYHSPEYVRTERTGVRMLTAYTGNTAAFHTAMHASAIEHRTLFEQQNFLKIRDRQAPHDVLKPMQNLPSKQRIIWLVSHEPTLDQMVKDIYGYKGFGSDVHLDLNATVDNVAVNAGATILEFERDWRYIGIDLPINNILMQPILPEEISNDPKAQIQLEELRTAFE